MSELPVIKQSILRMLQRMEEHDPLMYREILLRGRPGRWSVEVLKGDMGIGVKRSGNLADALSEGLRIDLENQAKPDAPTQPAPQAIGGIHQRTRYVPGTDDLFGPL